MCMKMIDPKHWSSKLQEQVLPKMIITGQQSWHPRFTEASTVDIIEKCDKEGIKQLAGFWNIHLSLNMKNMDTLTKCTVLIVMQVDGHSFTMVFRMVLRTMIYYYLTHHDPLAAYTPFYRNQLLLRPRLLYIPKQGFENCLYSFCWLILQWSSQ
jgi:hypothetical protein